MYIYIFIYIYIYDYMIISIYIHMIISMHNHGQLDEDIFHNISAHSHRYYEKNMT